MILHEIMFNCLFYIEKDHVKDDRKSKWLKQKWLKHLSAAENMLYPEKFKPI